MFVPGQVYHRRSDIHDKFGGQVQGGISTPKNHPFIFLFSSDSKEAQIYEDGWSDDNQNLFNYSGEGQRGDMRMQRGNLAIKNHVENGKDLHLFEKVGNGQYRYVGEMEYVKHVLKERDSDSDGHTRQAIVFTLRRVDT